MDNHKMDYQNSSSAGPYVAGAPDPYSADPYPPKLRPWLRWWQAALVATLLVLCVLPGARIHRGAIFLAGVVGNLSYTNTPPTGPPDKHTDPSYPCPDCNGKGASPAASPSFITGALPPPAVATGREAGPSSGDPVNLATGVETYAPPADLTAYNPNGPQANFRRAYFSGRAKLGLSSPGLSAGWFQNYDVTVQGPQQSGTWGAVMLTYSNGGQEALTPQISSSGQPTGVLAPPAGRPFLVQGQPGSTAGTWASLTVTWQDQTQWVFTPFAGGGYVLSRIVDRMGHGIGLAWSAARALTAVTDAASNTVLLNLNYDGSGNLSSVVDAYGRRVAYGFGSAAGVTGPVLQSVSQIGSGAGTPASHYSYGYAAFYGQPLLSAISVPSPTGSGLSTSAINYDGSGRVSSLVDANGDQSVFSIGTSSTGVQVKNSAGAVVSSWTRNFDGSNRDAGTTDAAGHTTAISYGATPYKPSGITDANGDMTSLSYDGVGNVNSITSARGIVTTYTYDYSRFALGRLVQVQEGTNLAAPAAPTTYTYYEPSGLVKTVTQPAPGTVGSGSTTTTSYTYDSLGNVLTKTKVGNNAASSLTTAYNYTQDGGYSQPAALGQPLTATSALGKVTHLRYDPQGRSIAILDALGLETDAAYNAAGQLTQTTLAATGQNGPGRVSHVTAYLYSGGPATFTASYDESGAQVRQVSYGYGPEGELRSKSGSAEPVSYAYDALYRLTAVADGKGQTTRYAYNAAGKPASATYPSGNTVQYPSYDGAGDVLQRVDGRGVVTNYAYNDPEHRLTDVQYPASPRLNVHLTYDVYGRRATMTDGAGSQSYAYDDRDFTSSVTTTYTGMPAQTISYGYYPDGSRQTMITPAGSFSYAYDADQHLSGLTNPSSEASAWTYLDNGWLKTQALGNGAVTTYTRDAQARLLDLANKTAGGTTLSEFGGMSYDGAGNRLGVTVNAPSAPAAFSGQTAYAYDTKDQLLQEQSTRNASYNNTFAYDGAGNPTTSRNASGNTFNLDNQVADSGFAYDGAGNPTTYKGNSLSFDPENHLTQYGGALSAAYTGDGLRAWKQTSAGRTYFLYDGTQPVVEMNGSGAVTAVNTFGEAGLLSRSSSGTSIFYVFDPQGNVAQRLTSTGSVFSSDLYDALGARLSTGGAGVFGYGAQWGYYADPETGLVLCTHRYYDPSTGRWLTRDPMGWRGGVNLYGYARNNSVNGADPSGYDPINLGCYIPSQPPIKGPGGPPLNKDNPPGPEPTPPSFPSPPNQPGPPPNPGDPPPGVPDNPTGPGFGGTGSGGGGTVSGNPGFGGPPSIGGSGTIVIGSGPATITLGGGGTWQSGGGGDIGGGGTGIFKFNW